MITTRLRLIVFSVQGDGQRLGKVIHSISLRCDGNGSEVDSEVRQSSTPAFSLQVIPFVLDDMID
jgi:hypothetical protein